MDIEQLYRRYYSHIHRLCSRYITDSYNVDDVVQTVFIRAMRSLHTFEKRSDYFTWLYRIAVNECCAFIRKNRRECVLFTDDIPDCRGTVDFTPHEQKALWKLLGTGFDGKERAILLLHAFEGVPVAEVAEILKVSRQLIHRKWKKIRMILQKRLRSEL